MSRKERKKIPRPIAEKIGAMRRGVIRFFLVDGLNRLLLALLVWGAVDFAIDRSFRMDRPQRIIMLVIGVCILLYVVWKYLLRPLFSNLSDDALLLQAEEAHGGFDESVISALELSRMKLEGSENVSAGMVHDTIERGAKAGAEIDLHKVFRVGKMRANRALLALLVIGLIVAGAAVAAYKPMGIWFIRNVMIGNAQWPQDYFLEVVGVENGKLRVPRGDDWIIAARVKEGHRSLPEEVDIEFKTKAGRRTESMVPATGGEEFRGEFRNVLEPFQFRVKGGVAETDWVKVELVERPSIDALELASGAPEYIGTEPAVLPVGAGPYYLLKGSNLGLKGSADKPLASAALLIGDRRLPLEIDGKTFSGKVEPAELEAGTYQLEIEDQEQIAIPGRDGLAGLGPREAVRFKLRIKDDRKPRVAVSLSGVSGMVVPGAQLPYSGSADDDFKIAGLRLVSSWKQDNSDGEPTEGEIDLPEIVESLGRSSIELGGAIEVAPLEVPVNSRLSMQFIATDNDTVSGPKTGESTKILLRVVGEAELRTDLLRREKEQRQVLTEMVKKLDLLMTDTSALGAGVRELAALDPSQRERLVGLQKSQKLMGSNLKQVVARLDGMVQEIINNRLEDEDGVLKARLRDKVITPLGRVFDEFIPVAALELDAARRAKDVDERNSAFAAAGIAQQAAIDIMSDVLVHMVRNEGYQQAVNLLYEIQRAQERMRQMTARAKEEALSGVVKEKGEEGAEDKTPKDPPPGDVEKDARGSPR